MIRQIKGLAVATTMFALSVPAVMAADFPVNGWETIASKQAARSQEALKALDDYAFDDPIMNEEAGTPIVRTDGLVVIKDGKLVYERYGRGYDKDKVHLSWSMAKSFTNALVGTLVKDGRINIDDEIRKTTSWPDTPGLDGGLTWRHLLTMSSGIKWDETYELAPLKSTVVAMLYTRGQQDMARFVASQDREFAPGYHWEYSSGDTTLMHGLIRDVVGDDAYPDYPWTALFDKIGMKNVVWEADPVGTYVGSSYMYATPRDYARFGYLFLNKGNWNGEQILPEGWVDWSCTMNPAYKETFKRGELAIGQPYGAQMWLNVEDAAIGLEKVYKDAPASTCMALGHWRQMIAILPEQNMVIVRVAHDRGLKGSVTNNEIIKLALAAFN